MVNDRDLVDFGSIEIKLNNFFKKNNISRCSLARNGNLRYDTILSYCREEVTRFDSDTLAKICYALNCNIEDIIEYKRK